MEEKFKMIVNTYLFFAYAFLFFLSCHMAYHQPELLWASLLMILIPYIGALFDDFWD